ncbi:MAG TPA: Trm112 family protein [Hyphomonadaceae bacterium]|nr:Trm112 family protein [Hyphomonadaceae bacterium]
MSNSEPATGKPAEETAEQETGVDPRLLEVLVCPVTRTTLTYDRENNELVSKAAGLAFPIRNGVPVMLRDEARDIGVSQ